MKFFASRTPPPPLLLLVVVASLLLCWQLVAAEEKCGAPFINQHTGGTVDPRQWSTDTLTTLAGVSPLFDPTYITGFWWCMPGNWPDTAKYPLCYENRVGFIHAWTTKASSNVREQSVEQSDTPAATNDNSTAATAAVSQLVESNVCSLACETIGSPPAMVNGQSVVTVTYNDCYTSLLTGLTFVVNIRCDPTVEHFTSAQAYSLLGTTYTATLKSQYACGVGSPTPQPAETNAPTTAPTTHSVSTEVSNGGSDGQHHAHVSGSQLSASQTGGSEGEDVGLSWGDIFLMSVFIPFGIYLIATITYNAVKGKRGTELAPHPDFWKEIPSLVKDGIVFTFHGIQGCVQGIQARRGAGDSGGYSSV